MSIAANTGISKSHIVVTDLADLFSTVGVADNYVIGTTAFVTSEQSNWICEVDPIGNFQFWKFISSSLFTETRLSWNLSAEPLISGNAPTGSIRNRYPILPTRNFSSNQLVCRSTLELDQSGSGSFVPLVYGVDYGLLPRTPQIVGGPAIGIGYGLASRPYGNGGPRVAIADEAVGFAVTQDIAASLTTDSRFRFGWTERTLTVQATGAKAAVVETVNPFQNEPSFSEAYGVASARNTGSFPSMNKRYDIGQFGVFFNSIEGLRVEIWRRDRKTKGGAYRDRQGRQVGLRRMSTGLTLLDRMDPGVFFGTARDVFRCDYSHEQEYHWAYWSDSLQARSAMSDLPIFRAPTKWLTTRSAQVIFRSGNVFWVGFR